LFPTPVPVPLTQTPLYHVSGVFRIVVSC
jgi:hypothetical protein